MEGGSQEIKTENGCIVDVDLVMDLELPPNPWPPSQDSQRSAATSSTSDSSGPSGASVTSISSGASVYYDAQDHFDDLSVYKTPPMTGQSLQLPQVNVPEKIILCFELSTENSFTHFRFGDGTKFTPFTMIKRIINIFTYNKNMLNSNHQIALLILHDKSATWIQDFTSNPFEITSLLPNIIEGEQPEFFDLTVLFDTIRDNVKLPPKVEDTSKIAPPFNVRVILFYSRCKTVPTFLDGTDSYKFLCSSPYFFLDLMYIHEPITDDNKMDCEEIFLFLCTYLCKDTSYVFNVARNTTKLHDCMSKLLAHALQRPKQEDADYKLLPDGLETI